MYCSNCGTKLDDDSLFCPECGQIQSSEADEAAAPADDERKPSELLVKLNGLLSTAKGRIAAGLAVLAVLLVVAAVVILPKIISSCGSEAPDVTEQSVTSSGSVGDSVNSESVTEYNICEGEYYTIINTPDGKGVDLITSDYTVRLDEGEIVRALADYNDVMGGYVHVYYEKADVRGQLWVEYMYHIALPEKDSQQDSGTEDIPGDDYDEWCIDAPVASPDELDEGMWAQVSYDTPGHAGINLRAEPSSGSALLCGVPEGALVEILQAYDTSYGGYIKVKYNDPDSGYHYTGWVLASYVEFYGYIYY